jgi:hypothetical protein
MKIIKQFEDPELLARQHHWWSEEALASHSFVWALGDDGELYFRCSLYDDPNRWYELRSNPYVGSRVNLKTMKRIVQQFEHLLVFL